MWPRRQESLWALYPRSSTASRWARNTAKKVEQAIKELDYHLNAYARGLKSNRTNTIAVILPTIAHPYFGLIAHCINSSLQKRGYRMLLCDTDYDNEKKSRK